MQLSKCAVDVKVLRDMQCQSVQTMGHLVSRWMNYEVLYLITTGMNTVNKMSKHERYLQLRAQNLMTLLQTLWAYLQTMYVRMHGAPTLDEVQIGDQKT